MRHRHIDCKSPGLGRSGHKAQRRHDQQTRVAALPRRFFQHAHQNLFFRVERQVGSVIRHTGDRHHHDHAPAIRDLT
jgi:hypothetical protein